MFWQEFAVAALALLASAVNAAIDTCCFVVQDEAHEVYWKEYATDVYTKISTLTSITTLLTVYPTTTITHYKTNFYPITKVFTTTVLLTANPVSLYPNPGADIAQKTEILAGSAPKVTGGTTIASPTGFFVYSTAKIFTAAPVTDASGNVACGTLLSFSNVPSSVSACVPTFQAMNSNAAAYYGSNGDDAVVISLTAPFVHIPTRTEVQISPSEVCAQGNGTVNYGYPAQQFINHLAGNDFYLAQYPGLENCLPAGPSIKALKALAVAIDTTTNPASTESATGTDTGIIDTTATTTTVTTSSISTTSSEISSATSTPSSTSTTPSTSISSPSVTAIPDSSTSPSITIGPSSEEAITSDTNLVTDAPSTESASSTTTSTSTVIVEPLPVTEPSSTSISRETSVSSESSPTSTEESTTTDTSVSLSSESSTTSIEETTTSDTSVSSSSTESSFSSSATSVSSSSTESSFSSSTVSSSTISDSTISSTPTSGSDAFTSTSTSEELGTTTGTTIGTTVSVSTIPGTITVPTTTTGLPPFSSSIKVLVPWRILMGLFGLVGLGIW